LSEDKEADSKRVSGCTSKDEPNIVQDALSKESPGPLDPSREANRIIMEEEEDKGMSFEDAVELLNKVQVFQSSEDYMKQLLWAGHTHLIDLFNVAVYLGFKGPKSSGKTTATAISVLLAKDGEMLSDTTEAYLSAVLDDGKTLGLDEADQILGARKQTVIASLLRSGYTRGAYRGYKEWVQGDGKEKKGEWVNKRLSLFGPKVFNFKNFLESALMSRTMIIQMEPCRDSDVAINNLLQDRYVLPVKTWLSSHAKKSMEPWTKEKLEDLLDSEEFRKEVKNLPGAHGRDYQIGAILLATCKVMDWELEELIGTVLKEGKTLDEFGVEYEVLEYLVNRVPTDFVPTSDILRDVNSSRKTGNLRSLSPHGLGDALKDLGFRKGDNYIKERASGYDNPVWGIRLDKENHNRLSLYISSGTSGTSGTSLVPDVPDVPLGGIGYNEITIPVKVLGEEKAGTCHLCNPGREREDLILVGFSSGTIEKVCPECFEKRGFKKTQ